MISVLLGVVTFAAILSFAVVFLIKGKGLSYSKHIWLFTPMYILSALALIVVTPEAAAYLNHGLGLSVLAEVALVFVLFQFLWNRAINGSYVYGYKTIPDNFKSILHLDTRQSITKIFEIFFQQICALLIIIGLSELGFSVLWISVSFLTVVFLLHLPSPKWFGKVYGNYFLWMSTLFAPLIPWLILTHPIGFYLSVSLHIFMYIVLYSFAYLWQGN